MRVTRYFLCFAASFCSSQTLTHLRMEPATKGYIAIGVVVLTMAALIFFIIRYAKGSSTSSGSSASESIGEPTSSGESTSGGSSSGGSASSGGSTSGGSTNTGGSTSNTNTGGSKTVHPQDAPSLPDGQLNPLQKAFRDQMNAKSPSALKAELTAYLVAHLGSSPPIVLVDYKLVMMQPAIDVLITVGKLIHKRRIAYWINVLINNGTSKEVVPLALLPESTVTTF